MKIHNLTDYRTEDLKKIVHAACQAEDFKVPSGAVVRVVYAKTNRISGWAAYGAPNVHARWEVNRKTLDQKSRYEGCAMLLRVPRKDIDVEYFIGLVRHEVGHWRGLRHKDMAGSLLHPNLFRLAAHTWAQGLTLGMHEAPVAPPVAERAAQRASERETHARKMLALHEAKLEREKKLVTKWKTKVRYYDRKVESVVQKIAASA